MRTGALVAVAAALAVGLSGCSQIDALAPVGGDTLAEVRFAANDVLVAAGVEMRVAPVCTASATAVTCEGSTVDGTTILVKTTSAEQTTLEVNVGSETLYSGSLQEVLDDAATGGVAPERTPAVSP